MHSRQDTRARVGGVVPDFVRAAILLMARCVIPPRFQRAATALIVVTIAIMSGACSDDGTASTPTSASTVQTVAEASLTEEFAGSLPVGGSAFYSFSVTQYGTVSVTLNSVGGSYVPATTWIGVGVGTPAGTDCETTSTANVQAAGGPHISGTYDVGVYCAKVWDIGNLFGPAQFTMAIAHP